MSQLWPVVVVFWCLLNRGGVCPTDSHQQSIGQLLEIPLVIGSLKSEGQHAHSLTLLLLLLLLNNSLETRHTSQVA